MNRWARTVSEAAEMILSENESGRQAHRARYARRGTE